MGRWWYFVRNVLGIIFRHPVLGTSIVPILPDGQIVMIRRRDTGRWALPGGMVAWGEDIPTTVGRELKEETGLEVIAINRLVGIYSAPQRDPRVHTACVVVEAAVQGTMQVQDLNEIFEVQSFSREALPWDHLSHDHDRQLQNYFEGQTTLA